MNKCIDCEKEITKGSKTGKCQSCAAKKRLRLPKKIYNCIDCGKRIWSTSIRCKKCNYLFLSGKNHWSFDIKSELHPSWRGGLPKCIECGKELSERIYKLCGSCSQKSRYKKQIHPCYIDGRSFEPYTSEFNNELKESIRKRDNYTCQNCGMTEEEHLIVIGRVLDVHHIDYNKKNCNKDNLIILCQQCNLRANSNRDYWLDFYRNKVKEILYANNNK